MTDELLQSEKSDRVSRTLSVIALVAAVVGAITGFVGFVTSYNVQEIEHRLEVNEHLDRTQDLLEIDPDRTTTYPPNPHPSDLLKAQREIRNALTITPDFPRARLFEVVYRSIGSGRPGSSRQDVEDEFEAILASEPEYLPAYLYYSLHLMGEGRYEDAIAVIESGLQRDPRHLDLRLNLSLCYLKTGDNQAGRRELRSILNDSEEPSVPALIVPALVNLAPALINENRFAEAEVICERAAELEPENAEILRHLGVIKLFNGKPLEAEEALRRCLQLNPPSEVAKVASENLAQVLFDLGRVSEAKEIAARLDARRRQERLIRAALQEQP